MAGTTIYEMKTFGSLGGPCREMCVTVQQTTVHFEGCMLGVLGGCWTKGFSFSLGPFVDEKRRDQPVRNLLQDLKQNKSKQNGNKIIVLRN